MEHALLDRIKSNMDKSVKVLKGELVKVQTGRANPSLLEDVTVDYYGAPTPLKHVANIVAPDPDLIVVRPFDRSQIAAMEKAILASDLGLTPQNDGELVRIKVPRLSEERRAELVKVVQKKGEDAKIALRNLRRDGRDELDSLKRDGDISEDEYFRLREQLDEITQQFVGETDELVESKAQEMRTL